MSRPHRFQGYTFIGRLENDPVIGHTTAHRKVAVLCLTASKLPLAPEEAEGNEQDRQRIVVWDEDAAALSLGLVKGDRVLVHGLPAGRFKDAALDPGEVVEFVCVSLKKLPMDGEVAAAPPAASLRQEVFEQLRRARG